MTTPELSRRTFVRSATAATILGPNLINANTAPRTTSETLVTQLYKSLKDEQKKSVCFDFNHPLRSEINNNWHITKPRIGQFFSKDQQDLIRQIFLGLHSEEYAESVLGQVEHDNGKQGFGGCSIALFGKPGSSTFEFVFTGRHVTRRCDGNSVEGAAFGGPIFYGHSARSFYEKPHHPDNIYWYQALRANELYQALDGKQQETALKAQPRGERKTKTVELKGSTDGLEGLPIGDLSNDQKELAHKVMADLLAPFRKIDADEAMKLVLANDFDTHRIAYYKNHDVGEDKVWDTWQIEGPNMVWHFRGDPHVHTWVHIRA